MTYAPITVAARRVLLDALEALEEHRQGLVLVGAQAIYLYTGDSDVAIATTTKDSDIALIPARLPFEPTLDAAMLASDFTHDRSHQQPGEWSSARELAPPVDLLVPEGLHAGGGRRGARIAPHSKHDRRACLDRTNAPSRPKTPTTSTGFSAPPRSTTSWPTCGCCYVMSSPDR